MAWQEQYNDLVARPTILAKRMRGRLRHPQVVLVDPDHGALQIDLYALRRPQAGTLVFLVFNGFPPGQQIEIVCTLVSELGDEVIELTDTDITEHMIAKLAVYFFEGDAHDIGIIPGQDLLNDAPLKSVP